MKRRKNSHAESLTYDQVEARKDRGVEGLRNMGADDAADKLEDESVEDFADRKHITLVNPRGKKRNSRKRPLQSPRAYVQSLSIAQIGKRLKRLEGNMANYANREREKLLRRLEELKSQQRNPRKRKRNSTVEQASQMFETFHGRKPTTVQDIKTRQNDRRNLTGLGRLMYLQTVDDLPIKFTEHDKVMLACDPAGNQLYFVGGNQDVSQILKEAGIDNSKDLIVIGECQYIIYTTDKDFDNFEEKDYQHEFGEETGELPVLIFDKLNRQLYLTGGAYEIKREGIVN